jgi:transcriptional regulator with XRE-family HTH domain
MLNLRRARLACGLTQDELARQCRLSLTTIARAERGILPARAQARTRLFRVLRIIGRHERANMLDQVVVVVDPAPARQSRSLPPAQVVSLEELGWASANEIRPLRMLTGNDTVIAAAITTSQQTETTSKPHESAPPPDPAPAPPAATRASSTQDPTPWPRAS